MFKCYSMLINRFCDYLLTLNVSKYIILKNIFVLYNYVIFWKELINYVAAKDSTLLFCYFMHFLTTCYCNVQTWAISTRISKASNFSMGFNKESVCCWNSISYSCSYTYLYRLKLWPPINLEVITFIYLYYSYWII